MFNYTYTRTYILTRFYIRFSTKFIPCLRYFVLSLQSSIYFLLRERFFYLVCTISFKLQRSIAGFLGYLSIFRNFISKSKPSSDQ